MVRVHPGVPRKEVMIKVCKTCGHEGDKENPLAIQGDQIVPYCHTCLKQAEKDAAETIRNSDWYIEWHKKSTG